MNKQPAPRRKRRRRNSNEEGHPDTKEKCEEEMNKQPAPRRSGRRSKVKDERPNTKEKCEEEMKKQPEPRRKRRHSNENGRPDMSRCEANAEEKTGETEEQEPEVGAGSPGCRGRKRPRYAGQVPVPINPPPPAQAPVPVNPAPCSVFQLSLSRSPQAPVLINLSLHETMRLYFSLHETMQRYFSLPAQAPVPINPLPLSGREASAEEKTGETEEPEPVNEGAVDSLQAPEPRNRAEFLKYSCQLTLDPNTAHRKLCLSEGNKKVTYSRDIQTYPSHPDRFDYYPQVLCREGLSGTRCYWEIECSGRGAVIGVTYKGISRKGEDHSCILGFNDKSWSLLCSDSSYSARHNNNQTEITAPHSPKIGVYLDFNAGTLSFYGVSDTMTLLHRFQTTFTEPLYPGFGPAYEFPVTICQLN